MNLNKLLSPSFCSSHNIDVNSNYEIEWLFPDELIVPERIDIIIKIKYVEMLQRGYKIPFLVDMYMAHIEAFSLGKYVEPGNRGKNSIISYFEEFNSLITSLKTKGFDPNLSVIPVGRNNTILNGSHRAAISAFLQIKVPVVRFDNLSTDYSFSFFRQRLLGEKYLDFAISEYCKLKNKNIYAICLWPIANSKTTQQVLYELLRSTTRIIYTKEISLNFEGLRSFIIETYFHQNWVGTPKNDFAGAQDKAFACYKKDTPLFLYLVESENVDIIKNIKNSIRNLLALGNHSVHSTDCYEETQSIIDMLLNKNSIHLLNNANIYKYSKLYNLLEIFKIKTQKECFNLRDFIIDSSASLSLYGLRELGDLDFLSLEEHCEHIFSDDPIDNNNKYSNLYNKSLPELFFDPQNYLIFRGMKFISLTNLKMFKINRNTPKDREDICLIDLLLDKPSYFRCSVVKFSTWIRIKKRNMKFATRDIIIRLLKAAGLHRFVRAIYRKIFKINA